MNEFQNLRYFHPFLKTVVRMEFEAFCFDRFSQKKSVMIKVTILLKWPLNLPSYSEFMEHCCNHKFNQPAITLKFASCVQVWRSKLGQKSSFSLEKNNFDCMYENFYTKCS